MASTISKEKSDAYDKLLKQIPGVERKGATMPYTSLNGNMFSFLGPTGLLALRLPEDARQEFLKKYKTTLFKSHNTFLKEYVTVPPKLLNKTSELKKYFEISFKYVKTLKPKPSKQKK